MGLQNWLFADLESSIDFAKTEANKVGHGIFIYPFTEDPIFPHTKGKKWIVQNYRSCNRMTPIKPFAEINPDKAEGG